MANTYRILFRQDTSANWTVNDPVLSLGEPGWETDTGLMKMGDGVSPWTVLDYWFGATGPLGQIGNIGILGPTGTTGPLPVGYATTGSNDLFGDQMIDGGIKLEQGLYINPGTFTGTATIPDGFNGSLVGPVDILGTINIEGSGVLAILG